MNSRKSILLSITVALILALSACGGSGGGPTPPPAISVAFATPPPNTLVVGTTLSLTAVVSNDSNGAGVNWTVTCGSTQCGSFNPASTASSAPTTYTAPAAIPTGNTVTLTATSVTNTSKSISSTVTITAVAPAVLSDGTYVFRLSGEDINSNGSPYFVAGAFTVLNKNITGGEQDSVDQASGITANILAAGSSLSTTAGGNIQIVLATDNNAVGVNGVETLRGTLVSGTHVLISEFDGFASATGTLDLQTSKAAPAGGYAFNLSGLDGGVPVGTLVIGGVLNFNGTAINVGNSVLDFNDNGGVGQTILFSSGSVTAPDNFGRITISLTPSTLVPQFALSGYIVGTDRIQIVENLQDTLNGVLGGTALGQGANTGTFTQASVAGNTYVFSAVGIDATGLAHFAGGFTLNPNLTVSGNLSLNDINSFGSAAITGGNWTIGPLGRVTISNITPAVLGIPLNFQLYLDGNGNALELGVDTSQVSAGSSFLQTANYSAGSYAVGGQGFANASGAPFWAANGPVTIDSSGNFNGATDYNILFTAPFENVALTGTTNANQGLFTLVGLNAFPASTADQFGFYPIDDSRVLAIEIDANQLGLIILEKVTPPGN